MDCEEFGSTASIEVECETCSGEGTVRDESYITVRCPEWNEEGEYSEGCPDCDGEGQKECESCGGT